MLVTYSIVALFITRSFASPTPKSVNPAHLNHLVARQCGIASWDSSNLDNWAAADTDAVFDRWWQFYLGGNGDSTSAVIPNNWPNDFVSP